jgi:predicted RNA binding protein YcfA (HicA-like mRNA interferase family)
MKKREPERRLRALGWWKDGEGGKHGKWTNGDAVTVVPRHIEINEITARSILRDAERHPGKGDRS